MLRGVSTTTATTTTATTAAATTASTSSIITTPSASASWFGSAALEALGFTGKHLRRIEHSRQDKKQTQKEASLIVTRCARARGRKSLTYKH